MNHSFSLARFSESRQIDMQRRLDQRITGLRQKLSSVYGETAQFDAWFEGLIDNVLELASQRSDALLALDSQRVENPDWFLHQNMVGYCAYVDRFADNLQGVKQRIPHLTQLGVRYLHLLPFFRARDLTIDGENDGGFAVASFDEIEPRLGTHADLLTLTEALRAANISLCADFVLNHVADDHPWALAAQQGQQAYQEFFHIFPDRDRPDQYEQSLGQVFPQAAPGNFSYDSRLEKWVWTTFYPYQWDLNYTNPVVFSEIALALLRMANSGIEVFRLDSTAFLWKRMGTNCMNQPEAHILLQAIRDIVTIAAPGVILKAEAIVPTADLPAYLGDASTGLQECHIAYHSSLMASSWVALSEQKVDLLQAVMRATPVLPAQASWLNYVRCHDDIGWNVLRAEANACAGSEKQGLERLQHASEFYTSDASSFADGERFQASDPHTVHGTVGMAASLCGIRTEDAQLEEKGIQRLMLMYGLAMSFGGIPLIYMGDEIAQTNDRSYCEDPARSFDGRWMQRPTLNTEALASLSNKNKVASVVHHRLCHLIHQRQQLPAFAAQRARQVMETGSDKILGFVRGALLERDHVVCLFNFSSEDVTVSGSALVQQLNVMSGVTASSQDHNGSRAEWLESIHNYVDVLTTEGMAAEFVMSPYSQRWLHCVSG
ncbi:alpha-amylase family glycosyl hydrolase [Undibacterium fentianense]|uniref:Amylosucrase n=1 Tax=Undibacterium fentianense TaxID=2828728 RepID=A0A941E4L9_9BURK|nr:alpha-amylase family glycosyl hydrolase [Undibacterium fentianense]MBR7801097.1 amylosucrase [Undibacterium fentianense]